MLRLESAAVVVLFMVLLAHRSAHWEKALLNYLQWCSRSCRDWEWQAS